MAPHCEEWTSGPRTSGRGRWQGSVYQTTPTPVLATFAPLFRSSVAQGAFGTLSSCQSELATYAAAPPDWYPANFLAAAAGTALGVIYVEDDDCGQCCAFEQRQQGHVQISNLEGLGEFIQEEPIVLFLADQYLADVADCSDALRSSESGSASDEAEENQWSAMLEFCFHFVVAPSLAACPHSVAMMSARACLHATCSTARARTSV